eukprot:402564-Hanusia_phi.AAC.1
MSSHVNDIQIYLHSTARIECVQGQIFRSMEAVNSRYERGVQEKSLTRCHVVSVQKAKVAHEKTIERQPNRPLSVQFKMTTYSLPCVFRPTSKDSTCKNNPMSANRPLTAQLIDDTYFLPCVFRPKCN